MGLEQFDPVHLILAPEGIKHTVRRARVDMDAIQAEVALLHERMEDIHRNVRQTRANLRDMEMRTRDISKFYVYLGTVTGTLRSLHGI